MNRRVKAGLTSSKKSSAVSCDLRPSFCSFLPRRQLFAIFGNPFCLNLSFATMAENEKNPKNSKWVQICVDMNMTKRNKHGKMSIKMVRIGSQKDQMSITSGGLKSTCPCGIRECQHQRGKGKLRALLAFLLLPCKQILFTTPKFKWDECVQCPNWTPMPVLQAIWF